MTSTLTLDQTSPNRAGRLGAWRALAALPAMLASAAMMLVLFGWADHWVGLILLGWLASGLLTLTRPGERLAVRLICRFRRPTAAEHAMLAPTWTRLLAACDIPAGSVDLYVQRSSAINAYATGSRSIAVTSRILRERRAGRLDEQMLSGLLAHELGHTMTAAVRYAPATGWLALPWRTGYRLILRLASRFAGRQPKTLLAAVMATAMVIAIVQAAQQHAWSAAGVLIALAVFTVLSPVTDAALSRAAERAADHYAAHVGHGQALARALTALERNDYRRRSRPALLDTHPELQTRINGLDTDTMLRATTGQANRLAA